MPKPNPMMGTDRSELVGSETEVSVPVPTAGMGPGTAMPLRALVIEDEESDRFRLITMCRRAGLNLEFHEAADAAEMREEIAAAKFDLIFIDYHLGFSNGLEVLEEIMASRSQADAILIMVTSANQHDVIIASMKSGCSDYLIKEELTVDSIQKSIATAFEKRLIQSALQKEQERLDGTRQAVTRFTSVIAPEMQRVMAAMLWRVRTMANDGAREGLRRNHELEALCFEALGLVHTGRTELSGRGLPDPEASPRPS